MDDGPTSPQQYICQRVDFTSKRLSKSSMGHNRLKGITFLGQVRGWSVLIFTQVYLSRRCFFFFSKSHPPFFMGTFPLYIPVIFNFGPPLVDHVGDLLDAYPIKNLLETLWVTVNWDIFAERLFPHKCS